MRLAQVLKLVGGLAVVTCLTTWLWTGRQWFTRWHDARLERADAAPMAGENELLESAGLTDGTDPLKGAALENRFALGLFPSGSSPGELISVASGVAFASVAFGVAYGMNRRLRSQKGVVP